MQTINAETDKLMKPKSGSMWRHRNGILYEVIGLSNMHSTNPKYLPTVTYRTAGDGPLRYWSRHLEDWHRSMTFVAQSDESARWLAARAQHEAALAALPVLAEFAQTEPEFGEAFTLLDKYLRVQLTINDERRERQLRRNVHKQVQEFIDPIIARVNETRAQWEAELRIETAEDATNADFVGEFFDAQLDLYNIIKNAFKVPDDNTPNN